MIQRFVDLSRWVSFAHHVIGRQVGEFATIVGRRRCVVDVGSGKHAPYKNSFDCEVYVGIDRFESAEVVGDAGALPLASGGADMVLCTETLEHLPEPQRALVEMGRVLMPGGYLILAVPLVWGEHSRFDYQRWTELGLRRMLEVAGFEIHILKRRGGIFAAVGCLVTRIPHQVFGKWEEQQSGLLRALYVLCWLVAIPIPWLLALLDPLDRTRAFTMGYSILCQKRSNP